MPDEPSRPWSPWRASPYITPEPLAKPRFRSRARHGRAEVRGGELCLPTHGLKAAALIKAMGRVTRRTIARAATRTWLPVPCAQCPFSTTQRSGGTFIVREGSCYPEGWSGVLLGRLSSGF